MAEEHLLRLRETLLARRREIFDRLRRQESDWQVLGERDIEFEEEAQKSDIASIFDSLDERGKEEVEAIDLALCRMAAGTYGICEECEEWIPVGRLEAMPEARLCVKCARKLERRQTRLRTPREMTPCGALPDEYRNLTDAELRDEIVEQVRSDGRIDQEELTIYCKRSTVYLEGIIPSETEHEILLQILTDSMGLTSIIDLLQVAEIAWEREDRTPGKRDPAPSREDQLSLGVDLTPDDLLEQEEELT